MLLRLSRPKFGRDPPCPRHGETRTFRLHLGLKTWTPPSLTGGCLPVKHIDLSVVNERALPGRPGSPAYRALRFRNNISRRPRCQIPVSQQKSWITSSTTYTTQILRLGIVVSSLNHGSHAPEDTFRLHLVPNRRNSTVMEDDVRGPSNISRALHQNSGHLPPPGSHGCGCRGGGLDHRVFSRHTLGGRRSEFVR